MAEPTLLTEGTPAQLSVTRFDCGAPQPSAPLPDLVASAMQTPSKQQLCAKQPPTLDSPTFESPESPLASPQPHRESYGTVGLPWQTPERQPLSSTPARLSTACDDCFASGTPYPADCPKADILGSLIPSLNAAHALAARVKSSRGGGSTETRYSLAQACSEARDIERQMVGVPGLATVIFSSREPETLGISFSVCDDDGPPFVDSFDSGSVASRRCAGRVPVGARLVGVQAAWTEPLNSRLALQVKWNVNVLIVCEYRINLDRAPPHHLNLNLNLIPIGTAGSRSQPRRSSTCPNFQGGPELGTIVCCSF
eukprot:SAG31_NODE_4333_length_3345_cov_1.877388_3_plen_311_part_00